MFVVGAVGLAASFSTNIYMFAALRFITAASCIGASLVSYVTCEYPIRFCKLFAIQQILQL